MRTRSIFSLIYTVFSLVVSSYAISTIFPTTLKDFGYGFNALGQLRQLKNNEVTDLPFEYEISTNPSQNRVHFDTLGEVITEYVYQMLLDVGLHKINITSPKGEASSFVFGTKTNFTDTKKLLILIHGAGVVRAGQWSRSLIIEQSIDHGTQMPYIKRAIELGYDVLVTNTNLNYRFENNRRIALKGNERPEKHIVSVWEQLIAPVFDTIESFSVVAHSYGGIVTLAMARKYPDAFLNKCFAIAFTDSVHSDEQTRRLSRTMRNWLKNNARNYVTSTKALGTDLKKRFADIPRFSAGHHDHKWTSWACIDALFPYIEEKYAKFLQNRTSVQLEGLLNKICLKKC